MAVKETVNVTRSPSASSFRFPLTSLMVKSPKSGSYTFKEEIVHNDRVKDWF